MFNYLLIGIGSAVGGVARYGVSRFFALLLGETFPWGTMAVNVTGSLTIGFFAALSDPDGRIIFGPEARQFILVGLCGGYTTFSTFSLQTFALIRNHDMTGAGLNILLSVLLCLGSVWVGSLLAAWANNTPILR